MYKFSDAAHTKVTNLEAEVYDICPGVWLWQEYQDWLSLGNTTQPFKTDEEYLSDAKADKKNDIRLWYREHENMPVTVGTLGAFNGGESSAGAINGAISLAAHLGQSSVKITDINNRTFEYSLQDAVFITVEIGIKASEIFYRKQELMCMVDDASTIEEVNLIVW